MAVKKFRACLNYKDEPVVHESEYERETKHYVFAENGARWQKDANGMFNTELEAWQYLSERCRNSIDNSEMKISRYKESISRHNAALSTCVDKIESLRRG